MKILAVIPCRQNSSRVPNKNLLRVRPDLEPNLVRTIRAVRECDQVEIVAVISDCSKARELASNHGCLALKEPPHVALHGDLYDVLDFALQHVSGDWDAVMMGYPNVPIRPPGIFSKLADLLITTEADSFTTVCPERGWGGSSIFGIEYLKELITDRTAIDRSDVRFLEYPQDELVEIDSQEDLHWAQTLLEAEQCELQRGFR